MLKIDFWNIVITVINLLVLYLAMKKFLIGPITGIMEKRKELIESQLAHAAETEQAALQLKSDYEKDLGNAKEESVRIVDKARSDAKAEYDRIVKDADAKASDIIAKANKTVEMQKQKTLQEMENEITGLALAAAAKIMNDKQDNDTALYNKFLAKAGDANDTAGN